MKIVSLKNTVMTASFLIALGYGGATLAHSKTGALGSAASATDVYRVTCFNDGSGVPHHLTTQVKDNSRGTFGKRCHDQGRQFDDQHRSRRWKLSL